MKPQTTTVALSTTATPKEKTTVKTHMTKTNTSAAVSNANPSTKETAAMNPSITTTAAELVQAPQASLPSAAPPAAVAAPPAPTATSTTTAGSAPDPTAPAPPATTPPLVYVKPPPAIPLPQVPVTTVAPSRDTRIHLPRKEELVIVPDAEAEIGRIVDYVGIFGKTAPTQAAVDQTLDSAYQWTALRIALVAWVKYCKMQEVNAWLSARALIARLQPAFALAVQTDPSIGEQNPSLASLFKVRSAIAKRGASTRAANKQNEANGQPAYAGGVGKKRKKQAAKAALAAQQASASPAVPVAAPGAVSTGSSAPHAAPAAGSAPPAAVSTVPASSVPPVTHS